ncbi:hypothetical protein ACOTCG_15125 [Achromobacter xylosoxidans]
MTGHARLAERSGGKGYFSHSCEYPSSSVPHLSRKQRIALSRWLHTVRKNWRSCLMVGLIALIAAAVCGLYLQGSHRCERAAIVIGWTLIGMLGLAAWVCRR